MALKAARDRQQQAIAAHQAERRVHTLEFVEIDENHRRTDAVVSFSPSDGGFQSIEKQFTVGQARQAAMHGIVQQPLMRALGI